MKRSFFAGAFLVLVCVGLPTSVVRANQEPVPLVLSQPIDGVRVVRDFGHYIAIVYRYVIGLAATAAAIMLVYGGFLYLLGSAAGDVGTGKKIIQDALIGLLIVLCSYVILNTVNPNTLSLEIIPLKTIRPEALPATQIAEGRALAAQNTNEIQVIGTSEQCANVATSCTCNQEMCTRFFGQARAGAPARPWVCATPPAECVSETCRIRCEPQGTQQTQQNAQRATQIPLVTCALDTGEFGCPSGQACMRTGITANATGVLLIGGDRAARQGNCSDGREGARCRCSGRGCELSETGVRGHLGTLFPGRRDVTDVRALQPTNNGWTGAQTCQAGLRCVSEGQDSFCRRDPSAPAPTPSPPRAR